MSDAIVAQPTSAQRPADHPAAASGRVGVLLINLGTPDATDYWSVRRYLKEFLSDKRVIELPRFVWLPILNLFVLTARPGRKGKEYAAIWNKERDESPLRTITRAQAEGIAKRLGGDDKIVVDWAMRYGTPSIGERLTALQARGCDRVLIAPLYPQYSATTTATACDKAFEALARMRWQPSLRVAPPWHDDRAYIKALANSVRDGIAGLDFEPEVLVASFHGVPKSYLIKGDPYYCHCVKTARLLRDELGLDDARFKLTFQSRFGAAEWLKPYTDETVTALAASGVRKIAVVTPGFVADCLETIEEIGVGTAKYFKAAGGEKFARIDCLNDSSNGIDAIEAVVRRELMGWA